MTRFSVTLAAAAASAIVATGVMALQAVGDEQSPSTQADRAKLEQCLRTERDARRCKRDADNKPVLPEELLACLRGHGLNPPTDSADQLKGWILRTPAAQACVATPPKEAEPGCGEKKPEVSGSRSGSAPA